MDGEDPGPHADKHRLLAMVNPDLQATVDHPRECLQPMRHKGLGLDDPHLDMKIWMYLTFLLP